MPYITPERRAALEYSITVPKNAGELNFMLAQLIIGYFHYHGVSYQTCNDVEGVLGCFGKEFYRRVTAPYEDGKIKTNGDVFQALLGEENT